MHDGFGVLGVRTTAIVLLLLSSFIFPFPLFGLLSDLVLVIVKMFDGLFSPH